MWSARLYHFKFFKGCLPQISLGPLLNTLSNLLKLSENEKYLSMMDPSNHPK